MGTPTYLLPRNEGRMKKLLLWDLDGTLSDDRHRQLAYHEKRYLDYFAYSAMMSDPVFPEARALYDELKSAGWEIGYLTARLERNRDVSEAWLKMHNFDHPERVMLRPQELAHMRPPQFKVGVLRSFIQSGDYDAICLVDNDPLVVDHVRAELGEDYVFFADWGTEHHAASVAEAVSESA